MDCEIDEGSSSDDFDLVYLDALKMLAYNSLSEEARKDYDESSSIRLRRLAIEELVKESSSRESAIEKVVNEFRTNYDLILEEILDGPDSETKYILKKDFDGSKKDVGYRNISEVVGIWPFKEFIRVGVSSDEFMDSAYNEICKPLNTEYAVRLVNRSNSTFIDLQVQRHPLTIKTASEYGDFARSAIDSRI